MIYLKFDTAKFQCILICKKLKKKQFHIIPIFFVKLHWIYSPNYEKIQNAHHL
jgi:hypothetical protein